MEVITIIILIAIFITNTFVLFFIYMHPSVENRIKKKNKNEFK